MKDIAGQSWQTEVMNLEACQDFPSPTRSHNLLETSIYTGLYEIWQKALEGGMFHVTKKRYCDRFWPIIWSLFFGPIKNCHIIEFWSCETCLLPMLFVIFHITPCNLIFKHDFLLVASLVSSLWLGQLHFLCYHNSKIALSSLIAG